MSKYVKKSIIDYIYFSITLTQFFNSENEHMNLKIAYYKNNIESIQTNCILILTS